jgi:hypothetical protein
VSDRFAAASWVQNFTATCLSSRWVKGTRKDEGGVNVLTLSQEIETWVTALGAYDNNEFDQALSSFSEIADTSKILFNCGVIHATLGEHEKAVSSVVYVVGT